LVELLLADHVLDVQERGAVEPDVDEGRLHAREHAGDLAEVHVPHRAAIARPLDEELGEDSIFDERDARLTDVDVDDERALPHRVSLGDATAASAPKPAVVLLVGVEDLLDLGAHLLLALAAGDGDLLHDERACLLEHAALAEGEALLRLEAVEITHDL